MTGAYVPETSPLAHLPVFSGISSRPSKRSKSDTLSGSLTFCTSEYDVISEAMPQVWPRLFLTFYLFFLLRFDQMRKCEAFSCFLEEPPFLVCISPHLVHAEHAQHLIRTFSSSKTAAYKNIITDIYYDWLQTFGREFMLFRRYVGDIIGHFVCPSFDPSVLLPPSAAKTIIWNTERDASHVATRRWKCQITGRN